MDNYAKASEFLIATPEGDIFNVKKKRYIKANGTVSIGYKVFRATLSKGNATTLYVHRLVATQHVPNPHNLPQVNHIDGNIHNNNASNLEWVTAKQNIEHSKALHNGTFNERKIPKASYSDQSNPGGRKSSVDDKQVDLILATYELGMGYTRVAKAAGTCITTVRRVLAGWRPKYYKVDKSVEMSEN